MSGFWKEVGNFAYKLCAEETAGHSDRTSLDTCDPPFCPCRVSPKGDRNGRIGLSGFRVLFSERRRQARIIQTFGDGIDGGLSMTEEIYEKFDGYNWDGDEAFKVSKLIVCAKLIEY